MSKCLDAIRRAGKSGSVLMFGVLLLCAFSLGAARAPQSYETSSSDERKVLTRVDPDYPDALKKLYIGGVVRVEVVVAPIRLCKACRIRIIGPAS